MALPVILRDDFTSINLNKWELIEVSIPYR